MAKLDRPLEALANAHVHPTWADNNFDGSSASVGATMWLDRPVHAQLRLAFVFDRGPKGDQQIANVCFALRANQKYILNQLSNIFGRHQDCKVYSNNLNWLAVELRRPVENPLDIREKFTTMLDNALTWWDNYSNNTTANGESA